MTKTLKISEEKALELYKTASSEFKELLEENFGKDFFKPKNIMDRIQDLDNIWDILGMEDPTIFTKPKSPFEKYINSCTIIPYVVKAYNESKELDWDNLNQYKYLPYYRKLGSDWSFHLCLGWNTYLVGPAGHHYIASSLGKDACKKFNQVYVDYFSFKG